MQPTSPVLARSRRTLVITLGLSSLVAALLLVPAQAAGAHDRSAIGSDTYTVQAGDSAWDIATRAGVSVQEVISANGLAGPDYMIWVGQTLVIPGGGASQTESEPSDTGSTSGGGGGHVVVKGESAWSIAQKYGVDVNAVIEANGLQAPRYMIWVGQTLVVPGGGGGGGDVGRPDASPSPAPSPSPAAAPRSGQCPVASSAYFGNSFGAPRDGGVRQHQGIDVFARKGTPVVATVSGRVGRAGPDTGKGGLRVWLNGDDGLSYYHAHLDSVSVSPGQRVSAGQVLGTVGNSGNAGGSASHLHFETHSGVTLNPYDSLKAACG
ncbi:MAG: LysM peptidoglycan-binding domain-containing M23 family metallopeptidase [Acidimicrobiia bacterium]|nr:LysM peptidoglycan-binding domain-containing M23 family metallopeptidase [Acidimicrobiia bacterium]